MNTTPSKKIRYLHLVQSFGVGGAETLLLHYIQAMSSVKYEHYVYHFMGAGPYREKIEKLGATIIEGPSISSILSPIKFLYSISKLIFHLKRVIKKNQIQIIQSHLRHGNQLAVFIGFLCKVPSFPTVHNTKAFLDRRSRLDFRVHFLNVVDFFIFRFARNIIAISDEVKNIIIDKFHVDSSKITVLKNGIVFDGKYRKIETSAKHFSSENPLKLIAVGRLTYQKAMDVLVLAASELLNRGFAHFSIQIAGDGEDREKISKMIEDSDLMDHIQLLGIRHDIYDLIRNSDIFVMPSRFEGLSIAMIEAMAIGMPIIASDAPGLKTYIKDGMNGLLFPSEKHVALADCILRLSSDTRLIQDLSNSSRESFESEFNLEKNIIMLDRLLSHLLSDSGN